jgi:hypothetical protein
VKKIPSFLQKNSPIILVVIFIVTLIPIIIISVYNHPLGDDLSYSMGVHNAIISGGSVFAVFQAAWGTVVNIYMSWQGTYSAVFLMSFQPGVFAEGAYAIVPLIMIGFLIFSTLRLRDGSNVIRCAVSAVAFVLLVITVASPAAISRSSSGRARKIS